MDLDAPKRDRMSLKTKNELARQESRKLLKKRIKTEDGWLLKIVENIDYISFEKLSLLNWLTKWIPRWYGSMSVVETYVICWLFLELIFFAVLVAFPHLAVLTFFIILVLVFLAYRLQNIFAFWFHTHVLTGRVTSPVRALILTLINFVELVVIFSILDFILSGLFIPAFSSIPNSLDYSIRVMTTLGWDKFEPVSLGYILFYVQIFSGIGTVAIVIGAVMSYFSRQS